MITKSYVCSVARIAYQRFNTPVFLIDCAISRVTSTVRHFSNFTRTVTHPTIFQAAVLGGAVALFGAAGAAAQSQQPREYERGIWYDISGIGTASLGPTNNEVDKLYNQGIRRVHIMVNENISQKAIHCDCIHDRDVTYFTYRNLNPDVKSRITREYNLCLKQEEITNKWCANADNYAFEFDKWGGYERVKRGHRFVWRPKFYRLGLLIDQLNKKNIEVIITIWPEPNSQYISSLSNLTRYVASSKHSIYGVELEDEENWSEVFTPDGSKEELDEAANKLIAKLRHDLPRSVKIGVTAAGRGGFVRDKFVNDALLTNPNVDFISFQAYQDVGWSCNPSKIAGSNSPGSLATKAIELVSSTDRLNKKDFILGLSAYQLDCSANPSPMGVSGTVNMYIAAKTSICEAEQHSVGPKAKIIGDSYFSEANIVKQRDIGKFYAHNFLSLCQIDSIKAHCGEPTAAADNSLLLSQLNRDCPNIISDLTNKVVVTPGQPSEGVREIYIRRQLSQ